MNPVDLGNLGDAAFPAAALALCTVSLVQTLVFEWPLARAARR